MSSARKYLALALAACQSKQFEEAGVFLAQASMSEGIAELEELLVQGEELSTSSENEESVEEVAADAQETTNGDALDWGDDEEDAEFDSESVSTVSRRKTTSVSHIGKIIAASMSASMEDEPNDDDDESDEENWSDESDPDFPGEALVPASFSSVKVKSPTVQSPVRLKTD